MTEYDPCLHCNEFGENSTFMWSTLHAMYSINYIIAAICDETNSMQMLLHTMWSEQQGMKDRNNMFHITFVYIFECFQVRIGP